MPRRLLASSLLVGFVASRLRIVITAHQRVVEDLELDLSRLASLPLLLTCHREELRPHLLARVPTGRVRCRCFSGTSCVVGSVPLEELQDAGMATVRRRFVLYRCSMQPLTCLFLLRFIEVAVLGEHLLFVGALLACLIAHALIREGVFPLLRPLTDIAVCSGPRLQDGPRPGGFGWCLLLRPGWAFRRAYLP